MKVSVSSQCVVGLTFLVPGSLARLSRRLNRKPTYKPNEPLCVTHTQHRPKTLRCRYQLISRIENES